MQAYSAPLVFGRALFVLHAHSALGPLVSAMFKMMSDLLVFGLIMVMIMLGFSLAFYGLFGDGSVPAYSTFQRTWLTLFSSMLGDFHFNEFDSVNHSEAGVFLLILYLCVMSLNLLNLLVAVLSTAHARVVENTEKESSLSEALLINHYRCLKDLILRSNFL
ncbi:unnamed protein product [Discosporangium mesarthrocarpum]